MSHNDPQPLNYSMNQWTHESLDKWVTMIESYQWINRRIKLIYKWMDVSWSVTIMSETSQNQPTNQPASQPHKLYPINTIPPSNQSSIQPANQPHKFYPINQSIHPSINHVEMAPRVSVNLISLGISCFRLWEEEPQTPFPMSFTWASHISASVLMGH